MISAAPPAAIHGFVRSRLSLKQVLRHSMLRLESHGQAAHWSRRAGPTVYLDEADRRPAGRVRVKLLTKALEFLMPDPMIKTLEVRHFAIDRGEVSLPSASHERDVD